MQEKQHVFRVSEWRMLIIFTIMVLVLSIASDGVFLKKSNIINLFAQNAIVGVITIGQFLVIVSGGIDLTVGSTVAITSIMYVLFQEMGLAFSIVLAVIIGILIGIINGLTVTKMKIIPFIATLITMGIVRGFAFLVVNGRVIYIIDIED
jgi:ribose transport system permease protein